MSVLSKQESFKLIQKEIDRLNEKENKTEVEKLKLRNLMRFWDLNHSKSISVFCPIENQNITNLVRCTFCPYGHMTECHYPYTCDSEYCNHYNYQEE